VRRVDYEFQRGGDEVLVLRPGVTRVTARRSRP